MIEYFVQIRDDYGSETTLGIFGIVEEAVEYAKEVEDDIPSYLVCAGYDLSNIDNYHINNPSKRFEVIVEVVYD